jgi:general secretion pathway protein G
MKTQERSAARAQRGVTLIEVLIVVAIMAMISGAVAFGVMKYYQHARDTLARTNAATVRQAAQAYLSINEGEGCPTMKELVSSGTLDAISAKKDPWGSAWRIECTGAAIVVSSSGADRSAGTADDIRVPPPDEET